jgi:two-component system NarL family sensor kinase
LQIISELLTNIEKHSGASEVTVLIRNPSGNDKITDGLVIYISDNGKGIEENLLKEMNSKKISGIKNRHYGIQNIKLRLKKTGGSIKYISDPGEGTEVEIIIGK